MTEVNDLLLRGAVALLVLVLIAAVLVRLRRRLQAGAAAVADRRLQVVERLALEPRRAIYLVRAGDRTLLVGASEAGLHDLGEVLDAGAPADRAAAGMPPPFAAAASGGLR